MKNGINKLKKIFEIRGFRFLLVGGLNTLVGYGSYAFLLFLGINYLISNTLSTIIGIIHSYIWNRKFTFNSNKRVGKELLKFILVYTASYLIGMLNIAVLVSKFNVNEYLSGGINLVLTTMISWFGHKYFSFKEEKK